VKSAPVSVQPSTIVKASIFSVIEDDEEDEAEGGGTNWAEKYIQAKPQQTAPPQIERRDPVRQQPEPAHSSAAAPMAKTPAGGQKQPSLNLNQDNVARFKGTDKTIVEGEDLDVPTWMRVRGKVGK
jgi:cell division protein FtsZ